MDNDRNARYELPNLLRARAEASGHDATARLAVAAMTGMIEDLEPVADAMKAAAGRGYSTATDLADWLVRELKMPFRQAHHVTGSLVKLASDGKVGLEKLTLAQMQSVEPQITEGVFGVLGVEKSVRSRTSYGGTAPSNVRAQAKRWIGKLGKEAAKGG
jgi:argininosuccinate lyase